MAYNKVIYDGSTLIDLTSDTVEPQYLVNGITAHDKSGASINGAIMDYIVEQGTDNNWNYRKWNSGVMEAWRYVSGLSANIATKVTNVYQTASNLTISMPTTNTFQSVTSVQILPECSSYGIWVNGYSHSTSQIAYRLMSAASRSNASFGLNLFVTGTWK